MTGARITLTVTADGRIAAQTHDTVGEQCLPYVQVLEDLLDAVTTDSEYTPDWWRTAAVPVTAARETVTEPAPLEDRR